MSAAAAMVAHGTMLSPESAAGRKGKAVEGASLYHELSDVESLCARELREERQLLLRPGQVQLHQLLWVTRDEIQTVGWGMLGWSWTWTQLFWMVRREFDEVTTMILWSGKTHLRLLHSSCVIGACFACSSIAMHSSQVPSGRVV